MANSSPPKRATVSDARTASRRRSRGLAQQLVADAVAERVVDELEAVDVEEEHRACASSAAGRGPGRAPRRSSKSVPVRQAGERVVQRLVGDAVARGQPLGDARHVRGDLLAEHLQPLVGLDRQAGEELERRRRRARRR